MDLPRSHSTLPSLAWALTRPVEPWEEVGHYAARSVKVIGSDGAAAFLSFCTQTPVKQNPYKLKAATAAISL